MIKINEKEYKLQCFPDGTKHLQVDTEDKNEEMVITWKYESDSELFSLIALAEHYKQLGKTVSLKMPYIPNARMDRVHSDSDVFTLKIFCKLINNVGFKNVYVLDAHSSVSLALLDNVKQMNVADIITNDVLEKLPKDTILYFPDEGSKKRYADMFPAYKYVTGMKVRDWDTGKIVGLDVITGNIDLTGKTILMIDDIIAYGGSFYYSALKLKELGVDHIYAYATHTENSILDVEKGTFRRLLDDGTVEKLFTTDSLFTGNHDKIQKMEV